MERHEAEDEVVVQRFPDQVPSDLFGVGYWCVVSVSIMMRMYNKLCIGRIGYPAVIIYLKILVVMVVVILVLWFKQARRQGR